MSHIEQETETQIWDCLDYRKDISLNNKDMIPFTGGWSATLAHLGHMIRQINRQFLWKFLIAV